MNRDQGIHHDGNEQATAGERKTTNRGYTTTPTTTTVCCDPVKVEMLKLAIHEQGDATILIVSERRPRLRDLWHRHEARCLRSQRSSGSDETHVIRVETLLFLACRLESLENFLDLDLDHSNS